MKISGLPESLIEDDQILISDLKAINVDTRETVDAQFSCDGEYLVEEDGYFVAKEYGPGQIYVKARGYSDVTIDLDVEKNQLSNCLGITSSSECKIKFNWSSGVKPNLQFTVDEGETWSQWNWNTTTVAADQSIYFRGNNPQGWSTSPSLLVTLSIDGSDCKIQGNVMGLLDNGTGRCKEIPCASCFRKLFYQLTSIIEVSENFLPATKLTQSCYYEMFYGCSNLTKAPELPVTALADYCYVQMLKNCTSLTKVPELPATTLVNACYQQMFNGCTSLKVGESTDGTIPEGATKIFKFPTEQSYYTNWVYKMFYSTIGTFTDGTPVGGNTYYWYE